MRISSNTLARLCVALLVLYPVSAILVWSYLAPESYGIMAALFATNAGTAFFVGSILGLAKFNDPPSTMLRFFATFIAVVCGLISATFWMADEVYNIGLRVAIVSPVVLILLVLWGFTAKAAEQGKKPEGEG